jgi:putative SOS response-associated peptidase YedK
VPADGFYEWETGPKGVKQPYLIRFGSGRPLALAGLWERWRGPDGGVVESVSVLTTRASDLVAKLHARMPVILEEPARRLWLDPGESEVAKLRSLLKPFEGAELVAFAVSRRVNHVANDDPGLVEPVDPEAKGGQIELL